MMTRKATLLATAVTMAAVLPLALLRPVARAQETTPTLPPVAAAPQGTASGAVSIDPQAQTMLTQAAAATAALKSFQTDMIFTYHQQNKSVTGQIKLWAERPNLFRCTMGKDIMEVTDKDFIWNNISTNKWDKWLNSPHGHTMANFSEYPIVNYFFDPTLAGLVADPDSGTAIVRSIGTKVWQGTTYQVISVQRQKTFPSTILAYFGPDHLMHRVVVTRHFSQGNQIEELTLTHFVPNPTLSPALFQFTPKPGTEVDDQTAMQRHLDKMMKQHQQEQNP